MFTCFNLASLLLISLVVSAPINDGEGNHAVINIFASGSRKRECATPRQTVAFSVGRKTDFTATANSQVIPMDHVFYDGQNYFDRSTNRFRVPFDGIYAFHFGGGNDSKKRMKVQLYAGNPETLRTYTYAHSTTHYGSASGFVILQLKTGDTVSMRLVKGFAIHGYNPPPTVFSGYLIQALA